MTTTSTQHKAGEGYSSHNKIPTVAGYREDRKRLEEEERQFEEEERKRKMEEERRQKQSEGEEQARDAEEQEGEGQPDEEEDHHESSKKGTIKSDRKKNPGSEEKDASCFGCYLLPRLTMPAGNDESYGTQEKGEAKPSRSGTSRSS